MINRFKRFEISKFFLLNNNYHYEPVFKIADCKNYYCSIVISPSF